MASGGERRMLFDIRGRRKHVVRVVYAILAILMGGSLFLVVGPVNIASLIGNSNSSSGEATKLFNERAERLERELRKHPGDEGKQLALIRTRISSGQASASAAENNGEAPGAETREEFEAATKAWDEYEKQVGKKANPSTAQLVAQTWYTLATNPTAEFEEAFENLEEAARVQKVYADAKPTASAYTTLAAFQLIVGNFKDGNASGKKAANLATSKQQRKEVEKTINEVRKQGKKNVKTKKEVAKAEKGKGKEKLENPFGGLGGSSSVTGAP